MTQEPLVREAEVAAFRDAVLTKLTYAVGKDPDHAFDHDWFEAIALAVVLDLDLDGQGAAAGHARAAHRGRVLGPGIEAVDLCGSDQVRLHHRLLPACASGRAIIPGLVDF